MIFAFLEKCLPNASWAVTRTRQTSPAFPFVRNTIIASCFAPGRRFRFGRSCHNRGPFDVSIWIDSCEVDVETVTTSPDRSHANEYSLTWILMLRIVLERRGESFVISNDNTTIPYGSSETGSRNVLSCGSISGVDPQKVGGSIHLSRRCGRWDRIFQPKLITEISSAKTAISCVARSELHMAAPKYHARVFGSILVSSLGSASSRGMGLRPVWQPEGRPFQETVAARSDKSHVAHSSKRSSNQPPQPSTPDETR